MTDKRSPPTAHIAQAAAPRLGVVHLLLWTGCCAVFFGLARGLAMQPVGVLGAVVLIMLALGCGTAWTGLLTSVCRWVRGARWPLEPGQWLLTIEGVAICLLVAEQFDRSHLFRNPYAVIDAVTACLFVLPLFSRKLPMPWKWLFGLLALVYVLPLAEICLQAWAHAPRSLQWLAAQLSPYRKMSCAAVGAAALAVADRLIGRRWGWLHWTGVANTVWLAILPWAMSWVLSLGR
ncbi:MAG TPA: hypothetical protein VJ783_11225 [Pirellulales bacterium]|nr:hypothetical protein [Pirellulales bacterium]